jgi:hypothetical protein
MDANKVMVANSAGAGSVVGYNYMDDGHIGSNPDWMEAGINASHMVGPHHVLFEGNYAFNAESDHTHGNSVAEWQTGYTQAIPNSPYLQAKPDFFEDAEWPWVDPEEGEVHTLPAKARFEAMK